MSRRGTYWGILLLLTAPLPVLHAQEDAPNIAPVRTPDFENLTQLFKESCYTALDDVEAVSTVVTASGFGFTKQAVRIGRKWTADNMALTYVGIGKLPAKLPAPQCALSAQLASKNDHLTLKSALWRKLGISGGRSSGKGGKYNSIIDIDGEDNSKRRLFFTSQKGQSSRIYIKIMLVKLKQQNDMQESNP
ncbi:hypothetical protein [Sphingorhabdus sp. Alg239-R122]|uniref:hypothetical protein n=1 Tax=Sphingorhabdus sp. Alg239-R122 TaxID=2305989 RepID=UPI0013DABC9C|nr:hypothetical protein [Sphingorhabdus sp. Alg239-R122]